MPRLLLGGVLGGFVMWFVGFLFWGTPLRLLALSSTDDAASAVLQQTLAQHLGLLGTGAYPVPWTGTPTGTQLYGQGPTALILYNSNGFANPDTSALFAGLILAIVCALFVGFAVRLAASALTFSERLKMVAVIAVAVTAYSDLGQPIFNHAPWRYFTYLWISDVASWVAAGAVLAWALPRAVPVQAPLE